MEARRLNGPVLWISVRRRLIGLCIGRYTESRSSNTTGDGTGALMSYLTPCPRGHSNAS